MNLSNLQRNSKSFSKADSRNGVFERTALQKDHSGAYKPAQEYTEMFELSNLRTNAIKSQYYKKKEE